MSERSELRSSREGRTENGVKNLKGARPSPKTFCYDLKKRSLIAEKIACEILFPLIFEAF